MVMGSIYFGNMYDKALREKIDGMDQHTGAGDMQAIQEQEKPDRSEMQNSLSAATWAWLSASAAVLAADLVTAAVYRRRRYKKR